MNRWLLIDNGRGIVIFFSYIIPGELTKLQWRAPVPTFQSQGGLGQTQGETSNTKIYEYGKEISKKEVNGGGVREPDNNREHNAS